MDQRRHAPRPYITPRPPSGEKLFGKPRPDQGFWAQQRWDRNPFNTLKFIYDFMMRDPLPTRQMVAEQTVGEEKEKQRPQTIDAHEWNRIIEGLRADRAIAQEEFDSMAANWSDDATDTPDPSG